MDRCKDCVHFGICKKGFPFADGKGGGWCEDFIRKADYVEVVRCKNCEFWGGVIFGNVCRRWSAPLAGMKNCTMPDDFCSYGERREGE